MSEISRAYLSLLGSLPLDSSRPARIPRKKKSGIEIQKANKRKWVRKA